MVGLGTIINCIGIIIGGLLGNFFNKIFNEDQRNSISKVCGISVIFIAIAGAMEGMLSIADSKISSGKSLLIVICLSVGTIIGELMHIERGFEKFGEILKNKLDKNNDGKFVNAFVTASLTVSIGAMSIVGAINDGLKGDYSTLAVKAIIDFIIIAMMSSSMGKGTIFSAIPVFIFEGSITLLAKALSPVLTDLAINYLSLVGSILIFCIGINQVFDKKLKVANMLPSVFLAIFVAYLPINL